MAQAPTLTNRSESSEPGLAAALRGELPSLAHCRRLLTTHGIVQFAVGEVPDLTSGTCTDDNARALLLAVNVSEIAPGNADALAIGEVALAFLERAQLPSGAFNNLADQTGAFLATPDARSHDADGRAMWALGATLQRAAEPSWRTRAGSMLERSWPTARSFVWENPRAYALLAAVAAAERSETARATVQELAETLADSFDRGASAEWDWWRPTLTWGSARPPHALLRAARLSRSPRYLDRGLRALMFLAAYTQSGQFFAPIGNQGWLERGGVPARYDQQPIEAHAMVDAWLAAFEATGDQQYHRRALEAFAWFYGANSDSLVLARPDVGGCCDGLNRGAVNANMGAESTLSYLLAHVAIARAARHLPQ